MSPRSGECGRIIRTPFASVFARFDGILSTWTIAVFGCTRSNLVHLELIPSACNIRCMHEDLFRTAAVESQARRLHGDVILQSTISSRLVTFLIVIVVGLAIAWVVFARYARTEPAKGILVPVDGASKIYAMRPGVVSAFMVKDGELVKAGQKLALVTFETSKRVAVHAFSRSGFPANERGAGERHCRSG